MSDAVLFVDLMKERERLAMCLVGLKVGTEIIQRRKCIANHQGLEQKTVTRAGGRGCPRDFGFELAGEGSQVRPEWPGEAHRWRDFQVLSELNKGFEESYVDHFREPPKDRAQEIALQGNVDVGVLRHSLVCSTEG